MPFTYTRSFPIPSSSIVLSLSEFTGTDKYPPRSSSPENQPFWSASFSTHTAVSSPTLIWSFSFGAVNFPSKMACSTGSILINDRCDPGNFKVRPRLILISSFFPCANKKQTERIILNTKIAGSLLELIFLLQVFSYSSVHQPLPFWEISHLWSLVKP